MTALFLRNLKRQYPTVAHASGAWVTDSDGNRYLDGSSGAIVANLGHGVAEIEGAIREQLGRVAFAHTSQFVSEPALKLAERLIAMAPPNFSAGGRAYFTSGGSESVETALKMARAYFVEKGELSRHLFISRWHSYHGSTLGALAVTGHPARRAPYHPLLREQPKIGAEYRYRCRCRAPGGPCLSRGCSLSCADELEGAILRYGPENVVAFIGEPVVGAALGAAVPGDGYWARIREICTEYGVLLIADEVMTGLGRVGAAFGLDLYGVEPDIIVLGKGLSAGYLPLGAVLASTAVVDAFERGGGVFEHGFTYSGHPVSCAAGLAVLRYAGERDLAGAVARRERTFLDGLSAACDFPFVGDVRGRGFMAGIELVVDRQSKRPFPAEMRVSQLVNREAQKAGLIVYPGSGSIDGVSGDHVMIAPPLTITDGEMEELFVRLRKALEAVAAAAVLCG